jgi:Ethanolamine utilization protein EutJ (predicted chaperonin)
LIFRFDAGRTAAVDIVRTAVLVKAEERVLRNALEKARVIARNAMNAVNVVEVKNEVAVAVGCCSLGVSVIRKGNFATSTWRALFILVSGVGG